MRHNDYMKMTSSIFTASYKSKRQERHLFSASKFLGLIVYMPLNFYKIGRLVHFDATTFQFSEILSDIIYYLSMHGDGSESKEGRAGQLDLNLDDLDVKTNTSKRLKDKKNVQMYQPK
ncbi:hypothetical protein ACJX0J_007084 [Zea mays]